MTWARLVPLVAGKEGFFTESRKYLGEEERGYGKEKEKENKSRKRRKIYFWRKMSININLKSNHFVNVFLFSVSQKK